jgi:quinohemoprotein ethanol dehydrogenase
MKRFMTSVAVTLLVCCGLFTPNQRAQRRDGSGAAVKSVDDGVLRNADKRAGDWLSHGRNYAETRFSSLNQINAVNVKELGLAWAFDTGTTRGLEATPIIVDGVIYTTGSWSIVYAIDAKTRKLLWKWDPEVSGAYGQRACCDVVNRGVAVYRGKVYVGVLDGRLAALNAETGKVVWQVPTVDQTYAYTITGAPRIVKGKVVIGNGGAEYGVRGYVTAYDAETGKQAWRFYIVPGDPSKPFESEAMEKAAKTWNGEWWKYGGGGTAWDSFAYDPDFDLLYVGTGNGSPWNQQIRSPGGGDNLYLSSIVALKPDTGKLVWYYQTTPGESWDFTATQHMILADLEIQGRSRKVLMQAPKNGFFYVLDRATGELISAEKIVPISWATGIDKKTGRPIENPASRYKEGMAFVKPSPLGAHNWQPMSYDPETRLVYLPAQDTIFIYAGYKGFQFRPGTWNTGVDFGLFKDPQPPQPGGFLLAWDPVIQKERWRVPYQSIWNSGTLSTAGNLVFQGTADGRFVAYSADKGQKLWEVSVGTGVIASPVTYLVDGVQYVSVMAGWGGSYALAGGSATGGSPVPGRLLTFALNGKAPLPEITRKQIEVKPIELHASKEVVDKGALLFARSCAVCHGIAAIGGGATADLRYSQPDIYERYPGIVLDGEFSNMGMPALKQWLSQDDVEAIRAYVLKRRSELQENR